MALTDQEKEELFADFMLKFAMMDKEEKKLNTARNIHLMKDLSRYYNEQIYLSEDGKHYSGYQPWTEDPNTGLFKFYGIYQSYLGLRKIIPFIVNTRKNEHLKHYNSNCSPNRPLEETDVEEINKIGKAMLDVMIKYLKGELD